MKTRNNTAFLLYSKATSTQEKGVKTIHDVYLAVLQCLITIFYLLEFYLVLFYLVESKHLRFSMVQQFLSRIQRIRQGNFYSFDWKKSFLPFKLYAT